MKSKQRQAKFDRKSTETQIKVELNIDGQGKSKIKTPIGLLTHMLELFTFHGFFDLALEVKGDTHVDIHHTNEDIGIALGKTFKKALGDNNLGIKRFGSAFAPMEDVLGHAVVDISGRGHYKINFGLVRNFDAATNVDNVANFSNILNARITGNQVIKDEDGYTFLHLEHFVESFAKQLGANVIITITNPSDSADLHTIMETVFKSLGMALDQATQIDPRRKGTVPSTKGIID